MDRALVYGTSCWKFKSSWARQVDDQSFMLEALAEADRAAHQGEVPVGAVIVVGEAIVARGRNLREGAADPTAHAEMIAIRECAKARGDWRLDDATLYVTLEPCPMCAGALVHARVKRVVYGCDDPKAGAVKTLFSIGSDPRLNHRFELTGGILAEECAAKLQAFFQRLRAQGKK